jgi:hypothetical protein
VLTRRRPSVNESAAADPDPDAWPVVYLDEEEEVLPGTLTELLVAELTGTGPDLADTGLELEPW